MTDSVNSWTSYPKSYNVGHVTLVHHNVLSGPCRVEEKVDGSQFSFGVHNGELLVRSRGRQFDPHAPHDLFAPACATVVGLHARGFLPEGVTYRAETLKSPKHNTLHYERVPRGNIILFDVSRLNHSYESAASEAERLGLEAVPELFTGIVTREMFDQWLQIQSVLGGPKIEGVVCKPVTPIYGADGKPIFAKYVCEAFKELHSKGWAKTHPTKMDITKQLCERYKSEARWEKAVQRRRDAGELLGEPKDIGPLMKDLQIDTETEIMEDAKAFLWSHYRKAILRAVSSGLPEWYKKRLLDQAFEEKD